MGSAPCPDCGLKSWDADDLIPGEWVCTCDDLDDMADGWPDGVIIGVRPVETVADVAEWTLP